MTPVVSVKVLRLDESRRYSEVPLHPFRNRRVVRALSAPSYSIANHIANAKTRKTKIAAASDPSVRS
jgi:hypothetical protein